MRVNPSLKAAVIAPFAALGLGAAVFGCSLTNVSRADCTSDTDCAAAFGAGSKCSAGGFCSNPSGCQTGHDCRRMQGGGACVNNACVTTIPKNDQCNHDNVPPEPPDLLTQSLVGDKAPIVVGGVFSLDATHDQAITQAIRLAVQDINHAGIGGRKVGVVFCDNGGPGNMTTGDARTALDAQAVDYLAGTLGVPYIVGPLTSGDSIHLIDEVVNKKLPTVLISPSATSPSLTDYTKRINKTDPFPLFWRTCPSDELQGQVLAEQVVKPDATITSVTVLYINDPYGSGLAHVFQKAYGSASVHIVSYDDTTPDDPAALAKVVQTAEANGDDAVVLIALHGSVAIQILNGVGPASPLASKKWFFTDGVKDPDLIATTNPAWIQALLAGAKGTAPASPSGLIYDDFAQALQNQLGVDANANSFLAHAYDATYVGAFGVVFASQKGDAWDGLDVAEGMSHLAAGQQVDLTGVDAWITGSGVMAKDGQIDINGTSGPLDFDASLGEAPGPVEVWAITNGAFVTQQVIPP